MAGTGGQMTYAVGVDLGTTYSAVAVNEAGTATVVALDHRSTSVPSAVFVAPDGETLVGRAAVRRGLAQPDRLAREFKRRMGDSVPLIVGGSPWPAEALTGRLLKWILHRVEEQQGRPPSAVTVTYPANWGSFKQDSLAQALHMAAPAPVGTLSEPEAAATWYASVERVPPGQVVAVYDLGGGTFDAAVLRKTPTGFDVLGAPEGVERLGGLDIDEAVFSHVRDSLGERWSSLDPDDPAAAEASARLRAECVDAKEALSSDTQVSIPVALPGVHSSVRLTRTELESMSRPLLGSSIEALGRTIHAAGLAPDDVDRVLLVGGTSRMPLVGRMVTEAFGRPFFVDAHPKHAICLGAAIHGNEPTIRPGPAGPPTARPAAASPWPPAAPSASGPPPTARRSRGRNRVLAAVAGLAVGLLGLAILRPGGTGGGNDDTASRLPPEGPGPSAEQRDEQGDTDPAVDAPPLEPTRTISVSGAVALAPVGDEMWVATSEGSLLRFDSGSGTPSRFPVTDSLTLTVSGMVVADSAIWILAEKLVDDDAELHALQSNWELIRVDPDTGAATDTIPIGRGEASHAQVAAGAGSLWVLTTTSDGPESYVPHLVRLDPRTREIGERIDLAPQGSPHPRLAAGDDRVWVAGYDEQGVAAIVAVDPDDGEVIDDDEIVVGPGAVGSLDVSASALWAAGYLDYEGGDDWDILRFDPADGRLTGEVPSGVGVGFLVLAASEEWVWAWTERVGGHSPEGDGQTLLLIDPDRAQAVGRLDLDRDQIPAMAVSGDTVWLVYSTAVIQVDAPS